MYKIILDKLKEFDLISIFRHQRPDGDAMFSALAFESYIKDNFPEKTVKIGGEDIYDLTSKNDQISDDYLKKSLAFILDTSDADRIDDNRALNAAFSIKIDHHPLMAKYADHNFIEPKASACAEILAKIFLSKEFRNLSLSKKTCEYLYCGIISDTINFRTTNVTYQTLSIASKLVKRGDLSVSKLVEFVMDKDIDTFKKSSQVLAKLQIKGRFGYIYLTPKDLTRIGITQVQAKTNIDEIGRIKDLSIWSIALETDDGTVDCSVRSKSGYIINTICVAHGGGGHVNAAAVKKLSKKEFKEFYKELEDLANG
jgi:nanoRNase/pAp phosphatase (c-di-AMP/oligoRNAs hydrolase)